MTKLSQESDVLGSGGFLLESCKSFYENGRSPMNERANYGDVKEEASGSSKHTDFLAKRYGRRRQAEADGANTPQHSSPHTARVSSTRMAVIYRAERKTRRIIGRPMAGVCGRLALVANAAGCMRAAVATATEQQ